MFFALCLSSLCCIHFRSCWGPSMTLLMKFTMAVAGCSGSSSANKWHTFPKAPLRRATNPNILYNTRNQGLELENELYFTLFKNHLLVLNATETKNLPYSEMYLEIYLPGCDVREYDVVYLLVGCVISINPPGAHKYKHTYWLSNVYKQSKQDRNMKEGRRARAQKHLKATLAV